MPCTPLKSGGELTAAELISRQHGSRDKVTLRQSSTPLTSPVLFSVTTVTLASDHTACTYFCTETTYTGLHLHRPALAPACTYTCLSECRSHAVTNNCDNYCDSDNY